MRRSSTSARRTLATAAPCNRCRGRLPRGRLVGELSTSTTTSAPATRVTTVRVSSPGRAPTLRVWRGSPRTLTGARAQLGGGENCATTSTSAPRRRAARLGLCTRCRLVHVHLRGYDDTARTVDGRVRHGDLDLCQRRCERKSGHTHWCGRLQPTPRVVEVRGPARRLRLTSAPRCASLRLASRPRRPPHRCGGR